MMTVAQQARKRPALGCLGRVGVWGVLLALAVGPTVPAGYAAGSEAPPKEAGGAEAGSFLRIDARFSSKCSSLRRGKMRYLQNDHPNRVINYRMFRRLMDTRQVGLTADRIAPGEENRQDLGCEMLSGMEQTWHIRRARFQETNP